jgi:hypothetical protein
MTFQYGQHGYTDSVTGVWTPYDDEPSNELGWKARDEEVETLRCQLDAAQNAAKEAKKRSSKRGEEIVELQRQLEIARYERDAAIRFVKES